jgi:protein-disulfide isomerase
MDMSNKRRGGATLPRRRTPAIVESRRANRKPVLIAAGFAVVGAVALILVGIIGRGGDERPNTVATNVTVPIAERSKGQANAPVTIVEYADLQCPQCARFSLATEPQIEQAYIATGIARIEFRHFAFLGQESQQAAEASECAAEQGSFFRYRDALYANQRGENKGAFKDDRLIALAGGVGLDQSAFSACLESDRHAARVHQQTEQGRALGVEGTPTFFINGTRVVGNLPFQAFKQAIEQAAAAAREQRP